MNENYFYNDLLYSILSGLQQNSIDGLPNDDPRRINFEKTIESFRILANKFGIIVPEGEFWNDIEFANQFE